MAATATSFGDGVFGITTAQTGIIIEGMSYDYRNSNKMVKDRTGNTTGVTYYDENVGISINGKYPKTSPFSGTLATTLTLGNPLSAYLKGGVTGGSTLIEGITLDYSNEDYLSLRINATFYPNVT